VAPLLVAGVLVLHAPQAGKPAPASAEEDKGVIQGTVIYEDGNPVNGATVYASAMFGLGAGITPNAKTDETGHFVIAHLLLGKYAVTGEKQDEDYPRMVDRFYNSDKFETVTLTSQHFTASVTVRLGPKAGVLVGTVADALTNAPINPCAEFRRAKEPNNRVVGIGLLRAQGRVVNAKYRVLIPSNTDVLVKVWYQGHQPWYYPGTIDKTQSQPLNLKPGEEKELDIRLEPDPNAPPERCGMPVGSVVKECCPSGWCPSRLTGKVGTGPLRRRPVFPLAATLPAT